MFFVQNSKFSKFFFFKTTQILGFSRYFCLNCQIPVFSRLSGNPEIIKNKMHTQTACLSRVVFNISIDNKVLQFYEGYFINFTIFKAFKIK